jgi:predicted RNase H-like nuclease (RuvC/YqgF family)
VFTEEEAEEGDDEVMEGQLEAVNQKVLMLQKEKERFASQLEAKRKASEKLEKLNQTIEQLEKKCKKKSMKLKNKKTVHSGVIRHTRTLASTKELQ